jgi:hypothetical protein
MIFVEGCPGAVVIGVGCPGAFVIGVDIGTEP